MRDTSGAKVIDDEECFEIVRKKFPEDSISDFRLVDYELIPIGEVNGYMGQYFTLRTTVVCSETPTETYIYHFFTKISPPASSPMYDWNREHGSFQKEVELYTTVFPEVLNGLEKRSIPECFLGRGNEKIVLEDMSQCGYGMTDKFVPFDLEHCIVVMRTLAKFHAKSIIFEELNKRNLKEEFSHCMHETLWPMKDDGMGKRMFDAAVKGTVSLIDFMGEIDDNERAKFKQRIIELSRDHRKKLTASRKFKNVICHGDLWANNILFRYDENRKPIACCLVDFQLARYNVPAHDILLFLQFTTTRSLRKNHNSDLFKTYWQEMAESLKNSGLDASTVFPWNEFIDSINELGTWCKTHGLLNIPVMLLDSAAASKYFSEQPELLESVLFVDRTPMVCEQFHQIPHYRERMLDALQELYEDEESL